MEHFIGKNPVLKWIFHKPPLKHLQTETWASNTSPQTVGISFRINDLCQKLSAICHLYRTTSHKFRISGVGLLTNGCFATSVESCWKYPLNIWHYIWLINFEKISYLSLLAEESSVKDLGDVMVARLSSQWPVHTCPSDIPPWIDRTKRSKKDNLTFFII